MGWYYTSGASKQDLIRELTTDGRLNSKGFYRKCLAHSARGNAVYTVWTICDKDNQEVDINKRWIGVDILSANKDGWGYKPLDESAHPYYYNCPLKFLRLVPTVANQEWRDEVVKNNKQQNLMNSFSDGDILLFEKEIPLTNGMSVKTVRVEDKKHRIYSEATGATRFRLSRHVFSNAFTVQRIATAQQNTQF